MFQVSLPPTDNKADRSLGSTMTTVCEILNRPFAPELSKAMRITGRCQTPVPYDTLSLEDDITLVKKASAFAVQLAASYAWSEQFSQLTLPLAAASLLHDDGRRRRMGMRHLKNMVKAIRRAETLSADRPELQSVLKTLAFQEETFAQEVMVYLERSNFDLESAAARDCQKVMRDFCCTSSSTKEVLESTFAHLSYTAGASNKNKKFSPSSLWFYSTCSPYVKASGMVQNFPSESEWVEACAAHGKSTCPEMKLYNKAFKMGPLPSAPDMKLPQTAAGVLKSQWRLSGPASHYNSSAAAAYLIFDAPSFDNTAFAWAGQWFPIKKPP